MPDVKSQGIINGIFEYLRMDLFGLDDCWVSRILATDVVVIAYRCHMLLNADEFRDGCGKLHSNVEEFLCLVRYVAIDLLSEKLMMKKRT